MWIKSFNNQKWPKALILFANYFYGEFDPGSPVERFPFPRLTASRHGVASTGRGIEHLWWLCLEWLVSNLFIGEFDPGSGLTLAACLTHASRAGVARNIQLPTNNNQLLVLS